MTVLTLAEAKATLNIQGAKDDVILADYVAAAVETVDKLCGPTDPVGVTDVIRGGGVLQLRTRPVLSLVSVGGYRTGMVSLPGLYVDNPLAGIVRPFGRPLREDVWTVSYMAGRATVPAAIKTGAKIIVQSLWSTQRGPSRNPRGENPEMSAVPGLGMAVPARALLALDSYLLGPAVG